MKKYIVFDMDGTLISSLEHINNKLEKYFNDNFPEYSDKLKYSLKNYASIGDFNDFFNIIFETDIEKDKLENIKKDLYSTLFSLSDDIGFIPGTIEKIQELKNNYKLFLSTGNSTEFASLMMKKGNIYDYFEYIIGGDKIPKTVEHIEIMKEVACDNDFCKYAVFVGDGYRDEEIAKQSEIMFIKIGVGINSIAEIDFDKL